MTDLRFSNESTIPEFLAALASPEDAHGSVAAAAVAAAMGASLVQMVTALPRGDDDHVTMMSARAALVGIQQDLLETIETETAARLFAACRLPHAIKAERAERENAIQMALRASTEMPLEVMRLCVLALEHADTVAGRSRRTTFPDIALAVALFEAAFHAARASVEARLPILTDAAHATSLAERIARLTQDAAAAADLARSRMTLPPT